MKKKKINSIIKGLVKYDIRYFFNTKLNLHLIINTKHIRLSKKKLQIMIHFMINNLKTSTHLKFIILLVYPQINTEFSPL